MKHQIEAFIKEFEDAEQCLAVQTSGSTGVPKRILVEKNRMRGSAQRTLDSIGLRSGAVALICLPMQYIAGKMMVVRALVGDMRIEAVTPSSNPLLEWDESRGGGQTLIAVTPHQLAEIMSEPSSLSKLQCISHVIIGGGAIPEQVEVMASKLPDSVAVYATYGMTETLSHIALRRINGANPQRAFVPLAGVTIGQDAEGCLWLTDELTSPQLLQTNDIVEMLPDGGFIVVGRRDNIISSGGIKLQLEQIERRLSEVISDDFMLTYVNDSRFGQALTMLYKGETTAELLRQQCAERVGGYEVPKYFFRVQEMPQTATGKPARKSAHQLAQSLKDK